MTDEQALKSFESIVVSLARQICRKEYEVEDYEQLGRLAVLGALRKYDPHGGASLETYVYGNVRFELLRHADHREEQEETARNQNMTGGVLIYGLDPSVVDGRTSPPPSDYVDARDWLRDALSRLPDDEAAAIRAVHLDGLSTVEAAKALGVAQQRVSDRVSRGMAKMKKWAASE